MRYHLMPEQRASLTSNRTAQRQPEVADENDNSVSRIERNFGFFEKLIYSPGSKGLFVCNRRRKSLCDPFWMRSVQPSHRSVAEHWANGGEQLTMSIISLVDKLSCFSSQFDFKKISKLVGKVLINTNIDSNLGAKEPGSCGCSWLCPLCSRRLRRLHRPRHWRELQPAPQPVDPDPPDGDKAILSWRRRLGWFALQLRRLRRRLLPCQRWEVWPTGGGVDILPGHEHSAAILQVDDLFRWCTWFLKWIKTYIAGWPFLTTASLRLAALTRPTTRAAWRGWTQGWESGYQCQGASHQHDCQHQDPQHVLRLNSFPTFSMASRRSSCGVAAMDSQLYCVGGNDGTMCLGKIKQFIFFIHIYSKC